MPSIADFAAKMRRMGDRFLDEVQRGLDFVAVRGLQSLQATRRFNDRTGNLRASFAAEGMAPYRRRVSANKYYARFVNDGTARMRARPFMEDARKVIERELPRAMRDVMKKIAR